MIQMLLLLFERFSSAEEHEGGKRRDFCFGCIWGGRAADIASLFKRFFVVYYSLCVPRCLFTSVEYMNCRQEGHRRTSGVWPRAAEGRPTGMQRWMFEQEPLYAYGNALLGRTYCTCKQPGHLVLTYWAFACLLLFLWLLDFFFFFYFLHWNWKGFS